MHGNKRARLVVPLLTIGVGIGWLLSALGIAPGIDWIWTLGLGAVGILVFVVSGIDKISVVVGPFFIVASLISVLRQTKRLTLEVEIPILVIVAGVLLLLAQLPAIPPPSWLTSDARKGP